MMVFLIKATEKKSWRDFLLRFSKIDVCQLPEFHLTYQRRFPGSTPYLWGCSDEKNAFAYPFYLTPVEITNSEREKRQTGYFDISSVYGYSGPVSTTKEKEFLYKVWKQFDQWCAEKKVIAEFIRFSLYLKNKDYAHPKCLVESNRPSALSFLPKTEEELMKALPSKTRNMLRKAFRSNLVAKEVSKEEGLESFKKLYSETMKRNKAPDFFSYDDEYFDLLFSSPKDEIRLFATYIENKMIAAAIAIRYQKNALYHLGASLMEYSSLGAGNLAMYEMSKGLLKSGVEFLTVGGGRTTQSNDPLYLFKKNNATDEDIFWIGKRVINKEAYSKVTSEWERLNHQKVNSPNLLFYR